MQARKSQGEQRAPSIDLIKNPCSWNSPMFLSLGYIIQKACATTGKGFDEGAGG